MFRFFGKWRLQRENARLREELRRIAAERAEIRDMAARAGIPTGTPTSSSSPSVGEDILTRLRRLTAQRENLELQARIARAEAEIETESQRLEQEIAQLEQQLQEPLTLCLLIPTAGQQVNRGTDLNIRWISTGPIGARLRIVLLKRCVLLTYISYSAPNNGTFPWQVPKDLPLANDYRIALQDPTSGLSATSEEFVVS
ncbi:MAG: hypothetical protein DDT19_02784 [Syntrophomonadaceae bacterium]|nr:hypothetical protein [Bacillota bacterium]